MTTSEAAAKYLADYQSSLGDAKPHVYNPSNLPIEQLPVIYGFNNSPINNERWYDGVILAEDGTCLGGHICSDPAYMPGDLGMLEGVGTKQLTFRAHYPAGYRTEFVHDPLDHKGLDAAYVRNQQ